jgi:hypothetical protein
MPKSGCVVGRSRPLYNRVEFSITWQTFRGRRTSSGSAVDTLDELKRLAKVRVAGSNPVFRSIIAGQGWFLNLDALPRVTSPVSKSYFLALSAAILSVLSGPVHGTAARVTYPIRDRTDRRSNGR